MPADPPPIWLTRVFIGGLLAAWSTIGFATRPQTKLAEGDLADAFAQEVRPLLTRYCTGCHSPKEKKGELDLTRFTSVEHVRRDVKPWSALIEQLDANEMPPKDKPQPTAAERKLMTSWARGLLDAEARTRAGDPGNVPLRRLSNAEYNYTIRDLTGVDLQPAREFPADGAAGEGFTNAAEALNMSPALLTKFFNASKEIAAHAVLLPDGFRFSPTKTRRDWTDESVARLRKFYSPYPNDGRLSLEPYVRAVVRHRDELLSGKVAIADVATKVRLNPKYLGILWETLTSDKQVTPLDGIQRRWQNATDKDVAAVVQEITAWQQVVWKTQKIGSQAYDAFSRQAANDSTVVESHTLSIGPKPIPGQSDITVTLVARDLLSPDREGSVVWHRPRFEGKGLPTLHLKDYAEFGPRYEIHYPSVFAETGKYLAAVVESTKDSSLPVDDLAKQRELDPALLRRWITLLALGPVNNDAKLREPELTLPAIAVELLPEKNPNNDKQPTIKGWKAKGAELPVAISNASDKLENVPGRVAPHRVCVHPTPQQCVAVAWTSAIEGRVRVNAKVSHAHPGCGNGVGWWLEYRRDGKAALLAEGAVGSGQEGPSVDKEFVVKKGAKLLLVVDPRDANHVCDLTEVQLTIVEVGAGDKTWDLAADVADTILAGNPHADQHGNQNTWSFVSGASAKERIFQPTGQVIPAGSTLAKWRDAATMPEQQEEAARLAASAQALLIASRPTDEKHSDRALYDRLVVLDGPLLGGLDLSHFGKRAAGDEKYGLSADAFSATGDLTLPLNKPVHVRMPAAIFRERSFVVEERLSAGDPDRVVQFQVHTGAPSSVVSWDGKTPLVGAPNGPGHRRLLAGLEQFRRCFPLFLCFPQVIPLDEVVCLKAFHREDEPLLRLFLDEGQQRELDALWREHRFISRFPVTENEYLPLFIGFVTQDQPKQLLDYFESQRGPFRKRAEEFERDEASAIPKHWQQLSDFASRAYRRPLTDQEQSDLRGLYDAQRTKGAAHDDAFRSVLARVLVSPTFLYHAETRPAGAAAQPVNDWELASRLSYFLWSSQPDDDLRRLAAANQLHVPETLAAQTRRMLRDPRTRALAIEFGTQWIHVRGFDQHKEKNERLFPMFDEPLRAAIYEESIQFFVGLFQSDRLVADLLDADYTFLNERLAKHYGIPNISGSDFRRVEGVKKYGRGGLLGLASVQATQAGASRTSPVLRGNWVVETLLGEKLPRPPANIPRLPEEETGHDGQTMRQLVERHVRAAECAVCHQRIDPFGFALEKYDPIGRLRDKDFGGLSLDAKSKLRDGTEFEGLDGLRNYLLKQKKQVVTRLFCRRLLGYAVGRSVTLSDQRLLDDMTAEIERGDGKVSVIVLAIVQSPQFRSIRGRDYAVSE